MSPWHAYRWHPRSLRSDLRAHADHDGFSAPCAPGYRSGSALGPWRARSEATAHASSPRYGHRRSAPRGIAHGWHVSSLCARSSGSVCARLLSPITIRRLPASRPCTLLRPMTTTGAGAHIGTRSSALASPSPPRRARSCAPGYSDANRIHPVSRAPHSQLTVSLQTREHARPIALESLARC